MGVVRDDDVVDDLVLGPFPQPEPDEADGLDVAELLDFRGRDEHVGEADLGEEQRQLLLAEVMAVVDLGLGLHLLRQESHAPALLRPSSLSVFARM